MSEEFNLSEKMWDDSGMGDWMIDVRDVKEFIKRRNKLDSDLRNNRITWRKYLDERSKLAGEKLI